MNHFPSRRKTEVPSQFTESRRKMILKLAGGDQRVLPLIHSLERMKKREIIYRWLIRNDITGEKLFEFFQERRFSWLQVAKDVLKRVEKIDCGPIIVGKDVF